MKKILAFWAIASLAIPVIGLSQPGTLDINFDGDGMLTIDKGMEEYASSVAIQSDQKIIVAGYEGFGAVLDFSVVRLNPDGSLDNTFGTGGYVTLDINASIDLAYDVHVQPDGKILLTGFSNVGGLGNMVIVRLESDGTLDPTFGANGMVVTMGSFPNAVATDSELLSNGQILVTGYYLGASSHDLIVARLNADGTLDNTFSFDGFASLDISGNSDIGSVVKQQADGKILVGGKTVDGISGESDMLLVRFEADGLIDQTFGTNGIVTMHLGLADDECDDLSITGSGKILVAGTSDAIFGPAMALAKLNVDGSFDTQFGNNGYVTFSTAPTESYLNSMIVTPDNRIVIAGTIGANTGADFTIVRREPDGTTDNTFGINGGVSVDFHGGYDRASHVVMQDDGLLLAVGATVGLVNSDMAVARFISGMNIGIGEVETYLGSTLIYPNPVVGQTAILEYKTTTATMVAVSLTDINGRLIAKLTGPTMKAAGEHIETLLIPDVAAGTYLLNIQTQDGQVAIRLTID